MELRDWAIRILSGNTLEEKFLSPDELTDHHPGSALIWDEPSRPVHLSLKKRAKTEKLPRFHEHYSLEKRAACLHRFAGHELLAVEFMAFALLALPDAPKSFRKGLAHTIKEEQLHTQLYINRLKEMGVEFGDFPLYRHFWAHTPFIVSPLNYVSTMSLTLEMANLDFAPAYGASFRTVGDAQSALLMDRIFEDEIRHVRFGCQWLKKLKPNDLSCWEAWRQTQTPLMTPKRAKGIGSFSEEARRIAGLDEEWIQLLKELR